MSAALLHSLSYYKTLVPTSKHFLNWAEAKDAKLGETAKPDKPPNPVCTDKEKGGLSTAFTYLYDINHTLLYLISQCKLYCFLLISSLSYRHDSNLYRLTLGIELQLFLKRIHRSNLVAVEGRDNIALL